MHIFQIFAGIIELNVILKYKEIQKAWLMGLCDRKSLDRKADSIFFKF